jgi:hypothetical protein
MLDWLLLLAHGGRGGGGPPKPLPMPLVVVVAVFLGLLVSVVLVSAVSAKLPRYSRWLDPLATVLSGLLMAYIPSIVILVGFVFLMVGIGKLPWPFIPLGLFVMGLGGFALWKMARWARGRITRLDVLGGQLQFRTLLRFGVCEYDQGELKSVQQAAEGNSTNWVLRFSDGKKFTVADGLLAAAGPIEADEVNPTVSAR